MMAGIRLVALRIGSAVAAIIVLTAAKVPTHPVYVPNSFLTGTSYTDKPESLRPLYVMGLIDGMLAAPLFGGSEESARSLHDCLEHGPVNSTQLTAIFDKYVKDNPEEWHLGTHIMMFKAMLKFCPSIK